MGQSKLAIEDYCTGTASFEGTTRSAASSCSSWATSLTFSGKGWLDKQAEARLVDRWRCFTSQVSTGFLLLSFAALEAKQSPQEQLLGSSTCSVGGTSGGICLGLGQFLERQAGATDTRAEVFWLHRLHKVDSGP